MDTLRGFVEPVRKFLEQYDLTLTRANIDESLSIMGQGMLGIFIVTGVIIAFILILNTVVEKVKESKENKE